MLVAGFPKDLCEFEYYLEEPDVPYKTRCIDNTVTCRSKCKGYCAYAVHPGYLTSKLMNIHKCLENECCYYYRLSKKSEKKKMDLKTLTFNDIEPSEILLKTNELTKPYEGMKIIKAEKTTDNTWYLYYVSIAKYDYEKVKRVIESHLRISVKMKSMNYNFEESAEIILNQK